MTPIGISDLSRGFNLRLQNAELSQTLTRLGEEVVTGRSSDTTLRLNGHFSFLTQIETDLIRLDAQAIATSEAALTTQTMQTALARIGDATDALVETLALGSDTTGQVHVDSAAREARGTLDTIVSGLNTSLAGRHLFSGTEVDQPALASADAILSGLKTAITGAVSLADIDTAANDFFDLAGGGFETSIYQGGDTHLGTVSLGSGETVQLDLKADDTVIRDLLKTVALIALADDPDIALPGGARPLLVQQQLDPTLTSRDQITGLRAELGFAEERIDRAAVRTESERSSLQLARNDLLNIDPFETASTMEAVRQQLETLYTVTVRTSRLSLVNFL